MHMKAKGATIELNQPGGTLNRGLRLGSLHSSLMEAITYSGLAQHELYPLHACKT